MDISKNKKNISAKVISQLQSPDDRENNKALVQMHRKMFDIVLLFVSKNNGYQQDAEDVFQEGLSILFKLAKTQKLNDVQDVEAYLYSICRNLWLKELNKKKGNVQLEDEMYNIPVEDIGLHELVTQGDNRKLLHLLNNFGQDCFQVLSYYYYEKRTMKEIAALMAFANEQVAKNKKSVCLKKMKAFVKDKAIKKEDLL